MPVAAVPAVAAVPEAEPEVEVADTPVPLAQPETSEDDEAAEPVLEEIEDEMPPLAGGPGGSWALVNFALMNLGVFESLMLLIGYFVNISKASEEDKKKKLKKRGVMRLISLPVAIVSVLAFCLTEDITLPTGFVDQWTLVMAIIAVVQTVIVALSRKKEMEDEETAR